MNSENEIEINDELIARYLSGEASPEEALALMDWLRQPDNKSHFEKFESTWNAVGNVKKPKFNPQQAWSKINVQKEKTHTHFLGMSASMVRIAASLLIVAVCGIVLYLQFGRQAQNTFATLDQTDVLNLPDQSKITLYHQTTIDYPVEFNAHERQVNLVKGEAFFEVAPDKQKPFVVHTATADIKVVGTKFNVVAHDDHTEISVEEGTVLVYTASDSVLLTKGLTSITYRNEAQPIHTTPTSTVNGWAYATQKLVFKNTPLPQAIHDIQKTYACQIEVRNPAINECTINVTFDRDSVGKIITLVADVLNLRVKKDGDVYILEGEGCR